MEEQTSLTSNPKQLSAGTLAFLGDAVYELLVRQSLITTTMPANALHRMAVKKVCAAAQSAAYEKLLPKLTEDEIAMMKRGRNTHSAHVAKNAKVADYRRATGLETLFGYLYLSGQQTRMYEIFNWIEGEENGED